MNKIAKTLSATVMAGVMALSLAVSASAECTHYNQSITCKEYTGQSIDTHYFKDTVNGSPVRKPCTQTTIRRKHTITCIVDGGCGYSTTDDGSVCYIIHSSCGDGTVHYH